MSIQSAPFGAVCVFIFSTLQAASAPQPANAFTPPACEAPGPFTDVPHTSPFCPWIKQLAADQITSGCGNGKFCPEAAITREQAAVMIELAMRGTGTWTPAENPFGTTVVVKGDGTPTENGVRLRAALNATQGSMSNMVLVHVEAGIFDIGSETLLIREWVKVRGAGLGFTVIEGAGTGTEHLLIQTVAPNEGSTWLEELSLNSSATADTNIVVRTTATAWLDRVGIMLNAPGKEAIGIDTQRSESTGYTLFMNESNVSIAGNNATGAITGGWIVARNSRFEVNGQSSASALKGIGNPAFIRLYDCHLFGSTAVPDLTGVVTMSSGELLIDRSEVLAGSNSTALVLTNGSAGQITHSSLNAENAVRVTGSYLEVKNSRVPALSIPIIIEGTSRVIADGSEMRTDGSTIFQVTGSSSLIVRNSTLTAPGSAFSVGASTSVRIGASQLVADSVSTGTGSVKCVASYDENFDALGSDCQSAPSVPRRFP